MTIVNLLRIWRKWRRVLRITTDLWKLRLIPLKVLRFQKCLKRGLMRITDP